MSKDQFERLGGKVLPRADTVGWLGHCSSTQQTQLISTLTRTSGERLQKGTRGSCNPSGFDLADVLPALQAEIMRQLRLGQAHPATVVPNELG